MAERLARAPVGYGATTEPVLAGDGPPAYEPRRASGGFAQGVDSVVRGDGVAPGRRGGPRRLRGGLDDDPDLPPRGRFIVHRLTTEDSQNGTLRKVRGHRVHAAMG